MVVAADLTDMGAVAALVDRVTAELGPLGLLVNNASIFKDDSPVDLDLEGARPAFRHPSQGAAAARRQLAAGLPEASKGWSSTSSTSASGS